jgi:peptidoglycan/LPS O-acetylase OafA/YrhL
VAWTLCYQEQFYLIATIVWAIAAKRWFRGLAIATAAILAFRVFYWDSGRLWTIEGFFPIFWQEFAVGLAVYWRLNVAPTHKSRRVIDLLLLAMLGIAIWVDFRTTAVASGFGLLLTAIWRFDPHIAAARWLAPLRSCGRRSYSIYLFHLPVCSAINVGLNHLGLNSFTARSLVIVPISTVVSLAVCWAFYAWVESRFINPPNFRERFSDLATKLGRPTGPRPQLIAQAAAIEVRRS